MTYSIVEIQGKQFKVAPGDQIVVDRVEVEEGKTFPLDKVLLVADGEKVKVGTPHLEKIGLEAKVIAHGKDKKIRVAKYKSKSRYRKVQGHRQHVSTLEIISSSKKAA